MKKLRFFKIFVISFLAGLLIIYGSIYFFLNKLTVEDEDGVAIPISDGRVNGLIIGVAGNLSDTLIFASFDMKKNKVDFLSIPRDTYYLRKGFNHAAQKKINAAYGKDGAKGSVKAVSDLLDTEIHYYIEFDYDAVIAIVDAIGGVEVEIPRRMDYDDPVDNLSIHFKEGQVVRDGEDIVKVLRWRKNNDGTGYKDGALGRMKMQEHVVKLGIEKLLKGNVVANFVKLQGPVTKYIKTDLTPNQMMYFANKAKNVTSDSIIFHTMPGTPRNKEGLSFFIVDEENLKILIEEIFEDTEE